VVIEEEGFRPDLAYFSKYVSAIVQANRRRESSMRRY
jgi:hypothetical protein